MCAYVFRIHSVYMGFRSFAVSFSLPFFFSLCFSLSPNFLLLLLLYMFCVCDLKLLQPLRDRIVTLSLSSFLFFFLFGFPRFRIFLVYSLLFLLPLTLPFLIPLPPLIRMQRFIPIALLSRSYIYREP